MCDLRIDYAALYRLTETRVIYATIFDWSRDFCPLNNRLLTATLVNFNAEVSIEKDSAWAEETLCIIENKFSASSIKIDTISLFEK